MNISIRVTDPGDAAAHRSLLNRLLGDPYVRENSRISVESTDAEAMGTTADVIQLVLDNGFALANLALAFAQWRHQSDTVAPVVVRVGGMSTVLSLDDMADNKIVHRALSGAPDPRRSRCVLIGVSDYAQLRPLPAVEQNLRRLEEVLTDPGIWGIPRERIHKIDYPESADALEHAIALAAEDAPDALVVYYAGHGLYDAERGLLLALPNASDDSREGTVPWSRLAEVIHQAHAARRVVLLDCCYGGLALESGEAPAPPDLLGAARVEGTYMLAATQKYDEARSPDGEACTAFTGELVQVLSDGVPPGSQPSEFLSLNAIHQEVRKALAAKRRPQPQRHDPGHIGQLPHFHNVARERRTAPRQRRARPRDWLPNRSSRYLVGGAAVLILLAVALWQFGVFSTKNTPLAGVSLTEYCSSQDLKVSGEYCVHPIDLTAACRWEHGRTDLRAKLTSADPNSAICTDSAQEFAKGISKMGGYCKAKTGATDAVATLNNSSHRGTWVCQIKIDMDVACVLKYKKDDLVARQAGDGTWTCYE
ncbi:caspase family protein [Actinomadura sp. KC216]|uniref:effector-associated constant component EACC1 n=1 Tax=Actinomadura sp. KC216 TaxID=2530370 RepID=UPI00104F63EC|nr:caspase family protein [Actinomadura sp. KC216]TDB76130.1 caspase family protein [Actinomadura sp. KC216]